MENEEMKALVKDVPQVISMIYSDIAQPSVQSVGKALGTVFDFITAPSLLLKFQNERFKLNYQKRLNEYKQKLQEIPQEKICEVNPQIGVLILEKLSCITNDDISDLFTTLLTNASNEDRINTAHPAFIQIIERMSCDEAKIIRHLKGGPDYIPYCSVHAYGIDGIDYQILFDKITTLTNNLDLFFKNNINMYMDNLLSAGILQDMHGTYKSNKNIYKPILDTLGTVGIDGIRAQTIHSGFSKVEPVKGYYQITAFGKSFIDACTNYKK